MRVAGDAYKCIVTYRYSTSESIHGKTAINEEIFFQDHL